MIRSRTRASDTQFVVPAGAPKRVPPPGCGINARTLDPSIARQIHDIDPHLVVEWVAEGRWWTGGTQPPGATLGCWRIGVRGNSGAVKPIRMWHPDCADGRLVNFIMESWGRNLFILRNLAKPDEWKRRQTEDIDARMRRDEQAAFDAMWNRIDHGALHRATRAAHEQPKWRGNFQVPAALTPAATPGAEP